MSAGQRPNSAGTAPQGTTGDAATPGISSDGTAPQTMTPRAWQLWAHKYQTGQLWHIGERSWVALHGVSHPIVPVLVEEVLGDPYAPRVTHYGWQYAPGSKYRRGDAPTMIQVRAGTDPGRAMMLLEMCFPYGLHILIERGEGAVLALRITEDPR